MRYQFVIHSQLNFLSEINKFTVMKFNIKNFIFEFYIPGQYSSDNVLLQISKSLFWSMGIKRQSTAIHTKGIYNMNCFLNPTFTWKYRLFNETHMIAQECTGTHPMSHVLNFSCTQNHIMIRARMVMMIANLMLLLRNWTEIDVISLGIIKLLAV